MQHYVRHHPGTSLSVSRDLLGTSRDQVNEPLFILEHGLIIPWRPRWFLVVPRSKNKHHVLNYHQHPRCVSQTKLEVAEVNDTTLNRERQVQLLEDTRTHLCLFDMNRPIGHLDVDVLRWNLHYVSEILENQAARESVRMPVNSTQEASTAAHDLERRPGDPQHTKGRSYCTASCPHVRDALGQTPNN